MYCGCAAPPPDWLKQRYSVDIDAEVSETIEELEIAPLPAELRGVASTHIAQAAQALGYDWQPQWKFMRPGRTARFDCGAKCMLGYLGYTQAALKLDAQCRRERLKSAWVVTAAGSGGTLAGLIAGLRCIQSPLRPLGIDVGKLWRGFPASIASLANQICALLGQEVEFEFLHTGGLPALFASEEADFSHA